MPNNNLLAYKQDNKSIICCKAIDIIVKKQVGNVKSTWEYYLFSYRQGG